MLAGRKTGGTISGEVRVNGFPKSQRTFARVAGYVEQEDVHLPQATVGEALAFSATLRLPSTVDKQTREDFIQEVGSCGAAGGQGGTAAGGEHAYAFAPLRLPGLIPAWTLPCASSMAPHADTWSPLPPLPTTHHPLPPHHPHRSWS